MSDVKFDRKNPKTLDKITTAQREVLVAMLDHKLVWMNETSRFFLLCGEAKPQGVREKTVDRLLDLGLITGPFTPAKKDLAKFSSYYKLTPDGRWVVKKVK